MHAPFGEGSPLTGCGSVAGDAEQFAAPRHAGSLWVAANSPTCRIMGIRVAFCGRPHRGNTYYATTKRSSTGGLMLM